MNPIQRQRNVEARILRGLRVRVHGKLDEHDMTRHFLYKGIFIGLAISVFMWALLVVGCQKAHAYSDEQIVNAIYKAEGGQKAKYPYGIVSVRCSSVTECRKVCLTTIKNNRKRFEQYGRKNHADFISFLASRFAPVGAENDPTGLNKNWVKNVRYFLAKQEVI